MVEQNNDLVVQANETRQQLAALKYSGEQLRERLSEIQKHADTLKSHVKRELGARNFEYLNSRTDYSTCANHHLADRAALEFKLAIITD